MFSSSDGQWEIPCRRTPGSSSPFEFSLPLPKGHFAEAPSILIATPERSISCHAYVLGRWPDRSVKWVRCLAEPEDELPDAFPIHVMPSGSDSTVTPAAGATWRIERSDEHNTRISHAESGVRIETLTGEFGVHLRFPSRDSLQGRKFTGLTLTGFALTDSGGQQVPVMLSGQRAQEPVLPGGPTDLLLEGNVPSATPEAGEHPLQIRLKIRCWSERDIQFQLTLHNPNAAVHENGLWDLGDPGSIRFNAFLFHLAWDHSESPLLLSVHPDKPAVPFSEGCRIRQLSSGGTHFQSPVHKNREGLVTVRDPSGEVTLMGNYTGAFSAEDVRRLDPVLTLQDANWSFGWYQAHFWQKFPNEWSRSGQQVEIAVFPASFHEDYELQGGEKSTTEFRLRLGGNDLLTHRDFSPSTLILPTAWIAHCAVLPHFPEHHDDTDPVNALIALGLTHKYNFFAKREQIDEFGWRHFGEIYADHETWLCRKQGNCPDYFISHYNNQYDPLYGMLRQYLCTGDPRWMALADDLARHVTDIDIYDTDQDKPEYNGGLFWHTDHYLDAATCSHRTYSKSHGVGAYMDHAGGGGPGGQHCYTTGLLLHYLVTGRETSRQAVVRLADWITRVYEGTGGVLEFLLAAKRANSPGEKNVLTGQYPLDRGTGNYLVAMLDALEATGDSHYLDRAARIVRHTVHPAEDLSKRHLDDVENTWFYTIFLQALVRFIEKKVEMEALDEDFVYARDALIHYARWMAEHEHPYLDAPDILEYPNHTWAAQDIRKAYVLYYAAWYSPDADESQRFLEAAERFYRYVADEIGGERTQFYTRILVILMQNQGVAGYFKAKKVTQKGDPVHRIPAGTYATPALPGKAQQLARFLNELTRRLLRIKPGNELQWLAHRSNKIKALVK